MKLTAMIAFGALCICGGGFADAQTKPGAAPATTPVTLPGATQFDLPSKIAGRTYRIFVYKPLTPPPASGYPVIYVTDGNAMFPLAAAHTTLMGLAGKGALVIGVGYATDE